MNQERVIIENISPRINEGSFFIKRVAGERLKINADIFSDGHDIVKACIRFKLEEAGNWEEVPMHFIDNDAWEASFSVQQQGFYTYFIEAWIDHPLTWQDGTKRKIEDRQNVRPELLEGAEYLKTMLQGADSGDKDFIKELITSFQNEKSYETAIKQAVSSELRRLFEKYPNRDHATRSPHQKVLAERKRAGFSTWYEFFPRSASADPGKHGTFKDCIRILPRIANMGFDVIYFPPIHPIGEVNRKGKNNATTALDGDVGSPWGIGSKAGGHRSIHPELGSESDLRELVRKAEELGMEIALDFALQCAPDHPYVKQHPEWFKWRPDGSVQYAENPPKKYQDILPIYFETEDYKALWNELLGNALYWIEEFGIRIFRVDNPHTKPFHFWGWLIGEIQNKYPDVIFLSEAFTKPKVMYQLAKQGFTQSYTYFTWRNSKQELTEYVNELTNTQLNEFFRPNFWPNTPDINPYGLQGANESVYLQRYFLAATLSSNTGIYGPVYEFRDSEAVPGKEEYNNSEKYEIRHWDWDAENKITTLISKINKARRSLPSLQQTNNIKFCQIDSDQLLAYYKFNEDHSCESIMVVSLDPYYTKQGWIRVPLKDIGITEGHALQVHDLITGSTYVWDKEWCYIELHPGLPFHLFKLKK